MQQSSVFRRFYFSMNITSNDLKKKLALHTRVAINESSVSLHSLSTQKTFPDQPKTRFTQVCIFTYSLHFEIQFKLLPGFF